MASEAEAPVAHLGVLDGLRRRLLLAAELAEEVRGALRRADAPTIDAASARLETVALEFKLLASEYRRLPAPDAAAAGAVERALAEFERTATRLARTSALSGGLLERLVETSRRLMGTLQPGRGESYLASGKPPELPSSGVRLREEA